MLLRNPVTAVVPKAPPAAAVKQSPDGTATGKALLCSEEPKMLKRNVRTDGWQRESCALRRLRVWVKDSTLRNCQVVRKAGEGAEDAAGEPVNRPPLDSAALGLLQLAKHPRDSSRTHPAARGHIALSI